jgi:hypothetical protein
MVLGSARSCDRLIASARESLVRNRVRVKTSALEPPPRATEQLFGEDGVYGPDIGDRILRRPRPAPSVKEIRAGDLMEGKITAGHAVHVQPYLACLAFRLDCAGRSLCDTGDSGAGDSIVELARGGDVLHSSRARPTAPRAVTIATTPPRQSAPVSEPRRRPLIPARATTPFRNTINNLPLALLGIFPGFAFSIP